MDRLTQEELFVVVAAKKVLHRYALYVSLKTISDATYFQHLADTVEQLQRIEDEEHFRAAALQWTRHCA